MQSCLRLSSRLDTSKHGRLAGTVNPYFAVTNQWDTFGVEAHQIHVASVAQLEEQLPCKHQVVRSNRTGGSKNFVGKMRAPS